MAHCSRRRLALSASSNCAPACRRSWGGRRRPRMVWGGFYGCDRSSSTRRTSPGCTASGSPQHVGDGSKTQPSTRKTPLQLCALRIAEPVLRALGRHAERVHILDRALASGPAHAELHAARAYALSHAHATERQLDEAEANWEKAFAASPAVTQSVWANGKPRASHFLSCPPPQSASAPISPARTRRNHSHTCAHGPRTV